MSGENPPPYQPEKTDYPPAPQQGYPPAQQGYPAPPPGYPPAPQQGYPPAQQGYPPPQPQGAPVVTQPLVTNVIVTPSFGNTPQKVCCPNCKTEQVTVVRRKIGTMNWLVCGVIALVLCILGPELLIPFCLIPLAFIALCIPGLKDAEHVCPNCDYVNGTHKQL
eukprot:TRINITY_DN904_c0_g1_i8.p1 TRINITY_DN904_c0_g1~~TRINITY_DN904_c0_g1_i8.p1  ORF type:complete len:164 (+),score=35.94 TRINITY_DN904_c0_g1_i8:36-527(+)